MPLGAPLLRVRAPLLRAVLSPALLSLCAPQAQALSASQCLKLPGKAFEVPLQCRLLTVTSAAAAGSPVTRHSMDTRAKQVLDFWLGEGWESAPADDMRPEKQKIWYSGSPEIDRQIVERFLPLTEALNAGQLDAWQADPLEALAGIIVGDQLARNAYRGTPQMYSADEKVLAWAKELVREGKDCAALTPIQRIWVYMPYMHSEALEDQDECVRLFEKMEQEAAERGWTKVMEQCAGNIKYAKMHRDVVARWGRFPHRNALLGRASTPEEAEGLANGSIAKF